MSLTQQLSLYFLIIWFHYFPSRRWDQTETPPSTLIRAAASPNPTLDRKALTFLYSDLFTLLESLVGKLFSYLKCTTTLKALYFYQRPRIYYSHNLSSFDIHQTPFKFSLFLLQSCIMCYLNCYVSMSSNSHHGWGEKQISTTKKKNSNCPDTQRHWSTSHTSALQKHNSNEETK